MNLPPLIALTGLPQSGKSSIAKHLVAKHGYTRVSFARPIKDMLLAMGLSEREVDGDLKEVPCDLLCGKTPRDAMRTIGTEWGRNMIGTEIWTNVAMRKVDDCIGGGGRVVIDDFRFRSEGTRLTNRNAVIYEIYRSGCIRSSHASDNDIVPTDWANECIYNDGSFDDLLAKFDRYLEMRVRS